MLYDAYGQALRRQAGFIAGRLVFAPPAPEHAADCVSGTAAIRDAEESIEYCAEPAD